MRRRKVILIVSAALTALLFLGVTSSVSLERDLPPLIRLHVVANSDSSADQLLKYKIRDEVVRTIGEACRGVSDIGESRRIVLASIPRLEDAAGQILRESGCGDKVRTYYGQFDFPARFYGAFSLPAGRYEALRLVIGEGRGANWWCVLFPPLCFVSGEQALADGQEISGEVEAALAQPKKIKIKPAFKIVKLINKAKACFAEKEKLQ